MKIEILKDNIHDRVDTFGVRLLNFLVCVQELLVVISVRLHFHLLPEKQ